MKGNRIYNFSAGPAMLPEEVLEQVAEEMLDRGGSGMSVMEMSHRSKVFEDILNTAQADLRKLLNIPDNYKILFMQGGATLAFSMIPMNFASNGKVDIIHTGIWTKKVISDTKLFADVRVVASGEENGFKSIPDVKGLKFREDADYVYICDNNTAYGSKYKEYPDTGDIPLVADMSSCFLSEPIDVTKFGIIFAGAQKNVGPAGVTIVIIREDLLERKPRIPLPIYLDYRNHAANNSVYNTPSTFGIYVCGLVFKWLLKTGGLETRKIINEEKAKIVYDYLDQSKLFKPYINKESRSMMNITFRTPSEELDAEFLEGAKKYRFANLKGHKATGGLRASLYNAMPIDGAKALVAYMKEFEEAHK